MDFNVKLAEGLVNTTRIGGDYFSARADLYFPIVLAQLSSGVGIGQLTTTSSLNVVAEDYLEYKKKFGDLEFEGIVGGSIQSAQQEIINLLGSKYISDDLKNVLSVIESESLVAVDIFITTGSATFETGVFANTVLLLRGVKDVIVAPSFLTVTGELMLVGAGDFNCVEVFVFGIVLPALFATLFAIGLDIILLLDSFDLMIVLGILLTTAAVFLFAEVDGIGVFTFFVISFLATVLTTGFAIFLMSPSFSKYTFPPPQSRVPFSLFDI